MSPGLLLLYCGREVTIASVPAVVEQCVIPAHTSLDGVSPSHWHSHAW